MAYEECSTSVMHELIEDSRRPGLCEQCRSEGKFVGLFTRQTCSRCKVYICSVRCYHLYHAESEEEQLSREQAPLDDVRPVTPSQISSLEDESRSPTPSPAEGQQPNPVASIASPVHYRTLKPPTKSKRYPQVPCFICRKEERVRRDTRYVCVVCNIGLCNDQHFETYHREDGYEIIPAARKRILNIPQVPSTEPRPGPSSTEAVGFTEAEESTDSTGTDSSPSQHDFVKKPPTPNKKYAQLACKECKFKYNKRRDTRYMCKKCNCGLCSKQCFKCYHQRCGLPLATVHETEEGPEAVIQASDSGSSSEEQDSVSSSETETSEYHDLRRITRSQSALFRSRRALFSIPSATENTTASTGGTIRQRSLSPNIRNLRQRTQSDDETHDDS